MVKNKGSHPKTVYLVLKALSRKKENDKFYPSNIAEDADIDPVTARPICELLLKWAPNEKEPNRTYLIEVDRDRECHPKGERILCSTNKDLKIPEINCDYKHDPFIEELQKRQVSGWERGGNS